MFCSLKLVKLKAEATWLSIFYNKYTVTGMKVRNRIHNAFYTLK